MMQAIRRIQPSILSSCNRLYCTRNSQGHLLRYNGSHLPGNRMGRMEHKYQVVGIPSRHMSDEVVPFPVGKPQPLLSDIIYGPATETPVIGVNDRIGTHGSRPFYRSDDGNVFTYSDLAYYGYGIGKLLAESIRSKFGGEIYHPKLSYRICTLFPSSFDYAVAICATWHALSVAVPLHVDHPIEELAYIMEDSECIICVHHTSQNEKAAKLKELFPDVEFMEIGGYEPIDMLVPEHIGVIHGDERICSAGLRDFQGYTRSNPYSKDILPSLVRDSVLNQPSFNTPAMFIYTSGTTGKPKAVSINHGNITSQVIGMHDLWQWKPTDHIVNVLPLHHVHGVINVYLTCMWTGARLTTQKFNPAALWQYFCDNVDYTKSTRVNGEILNNYFPPRPLVPKPKVDALTQFMAVPTIYAKLLEEFAAKPELQNIRRLAASQFRLMVSGSMALPTTVLQQWEEATGHTLLERYGMTEVGMALTNPLIGKRIPGTVGTPFNDMEARLQYSTEEEKKMTERDGLAPWSMAPGELLIRGPNVFKLYQDEPEATEESFVEFDGDVPHRARLKEGFRYTVSDKWFKTGDVAAVDQEGYVHILGRQSVDLLKVSGYKISALDVERVLSDHPDIAEIAVVGVPSEIYGQTMVAIIRPRNPQSKLTLAELRAWCRNKMADYKMPRALWLCEKIPRNAMSKINKKQLVTLIPPEVLRDCK